MWAARPLQGLPEGARRSYQLQTVGRLKAGVSLDAARDDLARIAADLAREYPATNEGRSVALEPLRDVVLGAELKRTSLLFLGVVGFVLLICFANIANLLLTRNAARGNELAIRSVLGADRRRLVRQFATENLVLAAVGGLAGLALAAVLLRVAPAAIPQDLLPAGFALDLDWRVAVFCAGATLLVAVLFTLASGRQVAEFSSLRESVQGGRTVTDRSSRTREVLVVAQVATAVVLLYGAGLLTRTLIEVDTVDPGYRAPSVLSMVVDPLAQQLPDSRSAAAVLRRHRGRARSDSGLRERRVDEHLAARRIDGRPAVLRRRGRTVVVPAERPTSDMQVVSPDYFRTLELPILAGRAFDERDRAGSVPVCIVNETFVDRRLRGGPAVGRTVQTWQAEAVRRTSRAPARSSASRRIPSAAPTSSSSRRRSTIRSHAIPSDDVFLIVRPTSGDAAALASQVRAAIARVDTQQLVSVTDIATLETVAHEATARYRFRALLIAAFAGLALRARGARAVRRARVLGAAALARVRRAHGARRAARRRRPR